MDTPEGGSGIGTRGRRRRSARPACCSTNTAAPTSTSNRTANARRRSRGRTRARATGSARAIPATSRDRRRRPRRRSASRRFSRVARERDGILPRFPTASPSRTDDVDLVGHRTVLRVADRALRRNAGHPCVSGGDAARGRPFSDRLLHPRRRPPPRSELRRCAGRVVMPEHRRGPRGDGIDEAELGVVAPRPRNRPDGKVGLQRYRLREVAPRPKQASMRPKAPVPVGALWIPSS